MLMWRGSSLSFLLHGSVFFGLIFGLPSLPDIFDRKKFVAAESELPVTVEVVTAEEVERLLDVITPDRVERTTQDRSSGKLAPLSITSERPSDAALPEDAAQPEGASASDRQQVSNEAEPGGARQTRIPEGQLDRQKIEQSKRQRAGGDLRRRQNRSEPTPSQENQPVTPPDRSENIAASELAGTEAPPLTETPQQDPRDQVSPQEAREGQDATPDSEQSTTSASSDTAQDDRQTAEAVTADTAETAASPETPPDRPPQPVPQSQQSDANQASAAQTATPSQVAAETAAGKTAQAETVAQDRQNNPPTDTDAALRETDRTPQNDTQVTPSDAVPDQQQSAALTPSEQKDAKSDSEEIAVEEETNQPLQPDMRNDFVQSVSGQNRELVLKVLSADRRLLKTIQPAAGESSVPRDAREKSLDRLRQAARQGYPAAQYNLAGKLLRGEDVQKDVAEARRWLTRAAEQGHVPAQTLLGLMRFTGIGLPRDLAETAFWWSLASDRGSEGAKVGSELVQPQLNPREHITAKRLRSRWGTLINDLSDSASGSTNQATLNQDLQEAAQNGDIQAVLSLLARGADADSAGEEGRSAVINAAWRGRDQIIRLLMRRGC